MATKLKQKKITIKRADGSKVRKSIYYRTAEELAAKILEAQKDQRRAGTFAEAADAWQDDHFRYIQHGTAVSYEAALRRAVEEFGDRQLESIQPADLQTFYNHLALEGYSKQTIHVQRLVVGQVFKWCCLHRGLASNPNRETGQPRTIKCGQKTPILPDDDVRRIVDGVDEPFGLFPFLLLYSGLRRGEALALTWSDIDLRANVIHVRRSCAFSGNTPIIKEPKTASGVRDVPLVAPLAAVLKQKKPRGIAAGVYLFSMVEKNEPITQTVFRERWAKWSKVTGYTGNTRQLRHLFATYCFESGMPAKDAQTILGHSSIDVTMDVYTEIRAQRSAVQKKTLDSFFSDEVSYSVS